MNISNLYRKIKQILNNSNIALINKGLNEVNNLYEISTEISSVNINRLPYALSKKIIEVTEVDLKGSTEIAQSAFENCSSLESVTIPDSVTTIGWSAFGNCSSLKSVAIGDGVITIDTYAFAGCHSLENVTIPDSVITIGFHCFFGCSNLSSVIISNNATSIGNYAFTQCSNLSNITIPNSVTEIGVGVFQNCFRLKDIYLNPITPPSLANTNAIPTTTIIHVPIGSGDAYKTATNWSSHADRIIEDTII